jgi:nucleotide-binding universal stress UspA family protein
MKKILIAVNDTVSSKAVLSTYYNLIKPPEEIVLLYVVKLEGRSSMIDMLGDAELSTLRESLKGTDYKEELDRKAENILNYYKNELGETVRTNIKTVKRDGRTADEILKTAEEEAPDLIILGYSKGRGLSGIFSGSVVNEVERRANVPVLLAKRATICEEPYTWRDAYYAMSFFTAVFLVLLILGRML